MSYVYISPDNCYLQLAAGICHCLVTRLHRISGFRYVESGMWNRQLQSTPRNTNSMLEQKTESPDSVFPRGRVLGQGQDLPPIEYRYLLSQADLVVKSSYNLAVSKVQLWLSH